MGGMAGMGNMRGGFGTKKMMKTMNIVNTMSGMGSQTENFIQISEQGVFGLDRELNDNHKAYISLLSFIG